MAKAQPKKADEAKEAPKAKKAEAPQHTEFALLPVKVQQERFLYAHPVQIAKFAGSVVIKGQKHEILDSAFNPETKRYEHALPEIYAEDADALEKELVSQGWIKQ